jgi:hypothetical protein
VLTSFNSPNSSSKFYWVLGSDAVDQAALKLGRIFLAVAFPDGIDKINSTLYNMSSTTFNQVLFVFSGKMII